MENFELSVPLLKEYWIKYSKTIVHFRNTPMNTRFALWNHNVYVLDGYMSHFRVFAA